MSKLQITNLFGLFIGLSFQQLSAENNKRSFMLTLWDRPIEEKSYFYNTPNSKDLRKVDLQEMTRSEMHSVDAQQIDIHLKKDDQVKKVISVKLNPAFKCSIVILKIKRNGEYQAIVLEEHPQSLPFGSYLLYNHSKLSIEGSLGGAKVKLPANTPQLLSPIANNGEPLRMELWRKTNKAKGKKEFLQRNTLSYRTNKYLIMLLYAEIKSNGRIHLKSKAIVNFKGTN